MSPCADQSRASTGAVIAWVRHSVRGGKTTMGIALRLSGFAAKVTVNATPAGRWSVARPAARVATASHRGRPVLPAGPAGSPAAAMSEHRRPVHRSNSALRPAWSVQCPVQARERLWQRPASRSRQDGPASCRCLGGMDRDQPLMPPIVPGMSPQPQAICIAYIKSSPVAWAQSRTSS